jgi:hypothetical protein
MEVAVVILVIVLHIIGNVLVILVNVTRMDLVVAIVDIVRE